MSSFCDAKRTVADFFNAHERRSEELLDRRGDVLHQAMVGKPAVFLTDVNGTLDSFSVGKSLDQFLVDVLSMGDRLQGVTTSVKIMSGMVGPGSMLRDFPFKTARALEEKGCTDTDSLLTKPFDACSVFGNADVVFDDVGAILMATKLLGVVAALDPASEECGSLLSAWCALGQSDEGKVVQEQVFQAWYNGQEFDI